MAIQRERPIDLAQRVAERRGARVTSARESGGWKRETFCMPRPAARQKAQEWFNRFPKAAYATEIEFWREMEDGQIEFTIRRLPSAD